MNVFNAEIAERMDEHRAALAEAAIDSAHDPRLEDCHNHRTRQERVEEASNMLSNLSTAVSASCPDLFVDYVVWRKVLLEKRRISSEEVAGTIDALSHGLRKELSTEMDAALVSYFAAALTALRSTAEGPTSFVDGEHPLGALTRQFMELLLKGDRQGASQLILGAVEEKGKETDVRDIYQYVFQQSQYEIGRLWQTNQISVAQEHLCTAATQLIMSQLYSHVFSSRKNGRTLVAACVGDELHEIGCRMVADFFEMDGWDTYYFGASTPTPSIVGAILDQEAELLCIAATMSFHIRTVVELITEVRAADPGRTVDIMVGGYCFNAAPDLWKQVGADYYARDARDAVAMMRRISV